MILADRRKVGPHSSTESNLQTCQLFSFYHNQTSLKASKHKGKLTSFSILLLSSPLALKHVVLIYWLRLHQIKTKSFAAQLPNA